MSEVPDVRSGQVWTDADPRSAGRTFRVERIEDGKAVCTILTNSDETQAALDSDRLHVDGYLPKDVRGKVRRISLPRFRPTSTGYRLVEEEAK